MGMAPTGMRCITKPPPVGLADTGNLGVIVSTNCVTCLYLHLLSTHISILFGHHTSSKRLHSKSRTRTEPRASNNFGCTCLQSRPIPGPNAPLLKHRVRGSQNRLRQVGPPLMQCRHHHTPVRRPRVLLRIIGF